MKFVDLEYENRDAADLCSEDFLSIQKSGKYLLSDFLSKFETSFSLDQEVQYSVGVKNATDALYMCFSLLGASSRTIIVPQFGAYPTVVAALQSGAKRVIAAPINNSLTLDLSNVDVPRDSIIVPVHLFGNHTDMDHIADIARATDSIIVEDCAQSTGLKKSEHSIAAIHSFYPTKPMGCRGDGGAILTDSEDLFQSCKKSRFYGLNTAGEIDAWGFNSRLDEWQSAFLIQKMRYYKDLNAVRQKNAKKILSDLDFGLKYSDDCVYHQLVTIWKDRDYVVKKLSDLGIPSMVHYPKMLCDMPRLRDKVEFMRCKRVSDNVISLPVGPHLNDEDLEKISCSLKFLRNYAQSYECVK
jgi:dTDP-4-amino-4,6-dideoxygalactose transaminase